MISKGIEIVGEFLNNITENKKDSRELLLEYVDESEIDDFYASVPASVIVDEDNVEMLTSMYKSLKRR